MHPTLPWLRNALARARVREMRSTPREEDVDIAICEKHKIPLEPPENHAMIDLYYWPTPNGHKITMFLEEAELPYRLVPVNIGKGEQFKAEFLAISPNNRMPAIVDHSPLDHGAPISVFESGAILLYLAQKTELFLPADLRGGTEVLQWLFWQVGGLGPMAGQNHHFSRYAPEKIPYAIERYVKETNRLYGVLNNRLADREFVAGAYSIADMAAYPWVVPHEAAGSEARGFPAPETLVRGHQAPAGDGARLCAAQRISTPIPTMTEERRKILFGQTADSIAKK